MFLCCLAVEMLAALPVMHEFMQQDRDVLRVVRAPRSDQRDRVGVGIVKAAGRSTDHGRNLTWLLHVLRVRENNRRGHIRRGEVCRGIYPVMKLVDQIGFYVGWLSAGRD